VALGLRRIDRGDEQREVERWKEKGGQRRGSLYLSRAHSHREGPLVSLTLICLRGPYLLNVEDGRRNWDTFSRAPFSFPLRVLPSIDDLEGRDISTLGKLPLRDLLASVSLRLHHLEILLLLEHADDLHSICGGRE
jgi:hypothetical protein